MNTKDKQGSLISVVVPIYNMEHYINRAVESLRKQTISNYEIILIDDGSTDNSGKLCDEICRRYPEIIVVHKPNGGLSSARNAGIEVANGDFIIFPDPDDWVNEDYLEVLFSLHKKYDSDLEIGGYFITDENSEKNIHVNKKELLLEQNDAMEKLLSPFWYCGFAWNKLYHMDIIVQNNLRFDTELGMAQDLHFALGYLMKCKKIAFNPKPIYHYFQHIQGVTNVRAPLTARKISGIKTYQKIADMTEIEFPSIARKAHSTIANLCMHFLFIYYYTGMYDKEVLNLLNNNIHNNMKYFIENDEYDFLHKLQGIVAYLSPKLYYLIRKARIDG